MAVGVAIFAAAFLLGTVFAPIGHDEFDETPRIGAVSFVAVMYTAFLVWSIFAALGLTALAVVVVPVVCVTLIWRWLW